MHSRYTWRLYFVIAILIAMATLLVYRLSYLTISDKVFLQNESQARTTRVVALPVSRGSIYDRNGVVLAASTASKSLWIDPSAADITQIVDAHLARYIGMNDEGIKKKILANQSREFMYLKRHMDPSDVEEVLALNLSGIGVQNEFKRYYPDSNASAQLVGRTNIDDFGQEGIELMYDAWLKGEAGKSLVVRDRLGRAIKEEHVLKAAQHGQNIQLTIDRNDQSVVYDLLMEAAQKYGAKSAAAVVLDAHTGEVLAMTNYPSYNPNDIHGLDPETLRNRAATDLFEPGSTIKPLSMLYALRSGKDVNSSVHVGNGTMNLDGHTIHDVHHDNADINLTDVLVHSSNVGIVRLILALPVTGLVETMRHFGFGTASGIGFPGEPSGMMQDSIAQGSFDQASLSFGYGVSVTLLQLAKAYLQLASKGAVTDVSLLMGDKVDTGQVEIDPEDQSLFEQIHTMMTKVVQPGGTGWRAAVKGFDVAGKTGTSYIATRHGYDEHRYVASFAGFAPAKNPDYVVATALWEPKGAYHFGGASAAPLFGKIMQHMLLFKSRKNTLPSHKEVH